MLLRGADRWCRNLGKRPSDLGLPQQSWEEVPARQFHTARRMFEANLLKRMAAAARPAPPAHHTPQTVADALVDYSMQITQSLRAYVAEHPEDPHPPNRQLLPGRLGDVTCVAMVAGRARAQREQRISLSASAPVLAPLRASGTAPLNSLPTAFSQPVLSSAAITRPLHSVGSGPLHSNNSPNSAGSPSSSAGSSPSHSTGISPTHSASASPPGPILVAPVGMLHNRMWSALFEVLFYRLCSLCPRNSCLGCAEEFGRRHTRQLCGPLDARLATAAQQPAQQHCQSAQQEPSLQYR